jgi:hypothetical protein
VRRGALVVLAVAALAGCGGGGGAEQERPDEDAGAFMTRLVREVAAGEYEQAWESLHPVHQRVARRSQYAACEQRDHIPGTVAGIAVLRVVDERVEVPGEKGTSAGAAITLRFRIGADDVTDTFHAVAVGRVWAWVLPEARYEAYRAGRCPGSAPNARA